MRSDVADLEKEALNLPPHDRERLAVSIWQSFEGVSAVDPEGIEVALRRNHEIESGDVVPIDHAEFMRRTSGKE